MRNRRSWSHIVNLKDNLLQQFSRVWGIDLDVELVLDTSGVYPKVRDYARTDGNCIYFSPKILDASNDRIEGLLRHELAHVILMRKGLFLHSEVEADAIAEWAFGLPIRYDIDDVQSISRGRIGRPLHLPN